MNLMQDFSSRCRILNRVTVSDGEGGYRVEWQNGPEFDNYAWRDSSMEARRAEVEGVTSVYTGVVRKDVPLKYGDYYKDLETDAVFRVTSRPEEKQAPGRASSMLKDLKCFTAERTELPDD